MTALTETKAALADLRASQSYRQYAANGTLSRTKLGSCERHLQAAIAALQPSPPKPARDPISLLGVYERTAFFVNPTAGSPVGGATEILEAAFHAGVSLASLNRGDGGDWSSWLGHTPAPPFSQWARCDTPARCKTIDSTGNRHDVANIESPEIVSGFCTPNRAVLLVGLDGAVITECKTPHADWAHVAEAGLPVFIEIDPNVPAVRDLGVAHLVEYGRNVTGCTVVPAFFMTVSPWWDGSQASFATYWDLLREQWPPPLPFALYSAENTPDWSVIR